MISVYEPANGFSFPVTFQANAASYSVIIESLYEGYIKVVESTNVLSYQLRVNTGTIYTSIPDGGILIENGDVLTIAIVAVDDNDEAFIDVKTINFESKNQPRVVVSSSSVYDRYIYALHYIDKTISCIDSLSDTVIATITLPSATGLTNWFTLEYRPVNKSVYVFSNLYVARIDADDASGTFNQVFNPSTGAANSALYLTVFGMTGYSWSILSIAYDHISDIFWGSINGQYGLYYNPVDNSASYNIYSLKSGISDAPIYVESNDSVFGLLGRFSKALNLMDRFIGVGGASFQWYDKIANCIIYSVNANLGRFNLDHQVIQTITIGANAGGYFHPSYRVDDYYYTFTAGGTSGFTTKVHVTNALTFVYLGAYTIPSTLTDEGLSSVIWSEAARKFYALGKSRGSGTGYNRIYIFSPDDWDKNLANISDLYTGFITAGNNMNESSSYYRYRQICKTGLYA